MISHKLKIIVTVLCLFIHSQTQANPKDIDIAIASDGQSEWGSAVVTQLQENLDSLGGSDFRFKLIANQSLTADWTANGANQVVTRALLDKNVEIVVALGVLTSSNAINRKLSKPMIAASVIDASGQGFPVTQQGTSGVENLHYLASNVDIFAEINRFQMATGANHIALLVEGNIASSVPIASENIRSGAQNLDFKVTTVSVDDNNPAAVISRLPVDVDAVFALPMLRLSPASHQALVAALNQRNLPSFSSMGKADVIAGYLMGASILPSSMQLSRQLAVDIRDIALGRSASSLNVSMDVKDRLILNFETARAIGYEPPFSILFEADAINELPKGGRVISLASAVEESLTRNLSVAIAVEDFRSAKQDTRIARSSLLPQLSASVNADARDRDLVGTGPTRTTNAGLLLSQNLYSESKLSNYTSSKYFQDAQASSLESTQLDVIQDTAESYLNVLIAKTEKDIQRDNLKLTRANLERAQFRYEVGSTNRSEVYRFETELGSALQSVSNARSTYTQSENTLNRLLQRPIEDRFETQEPDLAGLRIFGDARLEKFISSPQNARIFQDFLVQESLENAPELDSLESQILAQERLLLAAKRKRYVPDVDLVGSVDRTVRDRGTQIPTNFDEDWSIGIEVSLTLYQGSQISAERSQAQIALRRLQLLLQQSTDVIETSTRNAFAQAGASRRNIEFSEKAVVAALKTLELVTDSYERGSAPYIDLIDAQNSLLVAKLSATSATYGHLDDLIELQRAIGFFDFAVQASEEEAWFNKLTEYTRNYGIQP